MRPFDTSIRADFQGRYTYFQSLSKPVIIALNGATAGLGLIFALCADMRFASSKAVFSSAFSRRGLIAEHGSAWLLTQTVGPGKAADILFSARRIEAEEALSMGLIDRMYPSDTLMAETMAYATDLATAVSPRSLKVMKRQLWEARFDGLEAAIRLANREMVGSFGSDDFREGVAHFVEKRSARFTGA
jgi:enoyl-CoA hydratase/carnithine racemase